MKWFKKYTLVQLYDKWDTAEVPADGDVVIMDWTPDRLFEIAFIKIAFISISPYTCDLGNYNAKVWYSVSINATEIEQGPWQASRQFPGIGLQPPDYWAPQKIQLLAPGQRLKIRLWNKDPEPHVFRALVEGKMHFEETWKDRVRAWWRRLWR